MVINRLFTMLNLAKNNFFSFHINTFKKLDFGTGSALAMILGLITLFIAIVFYASLDRGEKQ